VSNCRKIEKLLWEYPDGEISPAEKKEVSAHLDECVICRRALETIDAIRESKKADRMTISSIDAFAFDNAVMNKIRRETEGSEVKTEDREYKFRMAISFGLAAAIVIFLVFSISDLSDLALHKDRGGKPTGVAEKKYDRIDIHLRPPESEKKLRMAPGRIAGKGDQTVESFSLLPAPVSRPAPDSVNIEAVYLTDETVPLLSQQARASLSEVVVDTGMIQSAQTPLSMLITVEKMPVPVEVVPPEYPVWAKKRGISGVVWVKARVDENGDIVDAQVLSSSIAGVGFEESALQAALKSRYMPAEANGVRLPVWIVYPVSFIFVASAP
jgi:TonB family protein